MLSQTKGILTDRFRWVICSLLFFGITKNYMDRQVLGVLKTTLQQDLGWSEIDYSNIVLAFQAAYAVGMVVGGRLIDRLGTRWGYAGAMVFWSLASMGHAIAGGLSGFVAARTTLGFCQASVFPASMKTVAEWFPKKERALATGIFNAGTSVGAVLTPLFIPWITIHFGWHVAFLATGGTGFVWLIFWLLLYRQPEENRHVSPSELAYIRSDPVAPKGAGVKWIELLAHRQTWTFVMGKFITDPSWWFLLFWVPDFLQRKHGLHLSEVGLPLVVIYTIADIGSVGGGWLSSSLIQRGWSANAGRKTALLVCAVGVLPILFAYQTSNLWTAVLLIGLAAAAHQGFSANLFTLPSDMFPSREVGSVIGLGGMAGAISGMAISKTIGYVLQWTGSYRIPFLIAGASYLVGVAVIHLLSPRLEPCLESS
jgi:ACS family hexuronate transporter-like MFS transporter